MGGNLLKGALLTIPFLGIAAVLPRGRALVFLALLLTLIAGVYLGFALLERHQRRKVLEGAGVFITFALAAAGLWLDVVYLAGGYLFHGLWDLMHDPGPIRTHVPRWYAHACTSFDWVVGAFILVWFR